MHIPQVVIIAISTLLFTACSTHHETQKPEPSVPDYNSPAELFKSEQCPKKVMHSRGDKLMVLKPRHKLLHEDADIFCVQKLLKGAQFLKVTSTLEPWTDEKSPPGQLKFLATGFDLVVYDQTMTKLSAPKPGHFLTGTNEFVAYYDFSKLKKFPAFFAILFRSENRNQAIYTKTSPHATEHSSLTSAMGAAMGGGIAAGSAVSLSQEKSQLTHSIYSKNPSELRAEWVSGIPRSTK